MCTNGMFEMVATIWKWKEIDKKVKIEAFEMIFELIIYDRVCKSVHKEVVRRWCGEDDEEKIFEMEVSLLGGNTLDGVDKSVREDMMDRIENFEGGNLECLATSFGEWWKEVDEEGRNLLTVNCVPDLVVWRRWDGCGEWKEDYCKRVMTLMGCKSG